MNKILRYVGCALMAAFALASCSPEDYDGVNEAGIPKLEDAIYSVTVDQSTNTVTYSFDTPGMYPIWTIDGKTVTNTTVKKFYALAGDYNYSLQVGNRNGVSDGKIDGTPH